MTCARDIKSAPAAPPDDLIPVAEAAVLADLKEKTIRAWIKRAKLRAWRRLGRLYVSRAELEGTIDYQPVEPWG